MSIVKSASNEVSAYSATSQFLQRPFDGDKLRFAQFRREILNEIVTKAGNTAKVYLTTAWQMDPTTSEPQVDAEFNRDPQPPVLAANASTERVALRQQQVKDVKSKNKELDEMFSAIQGVILSRVTPSIAMDLGDSFHNLYRFWKTIEAKYGNHAMDHLDNGDEFIRLIFRNKMQTSEKFSTFIVRFNSEADVITLNVNFRLGLILISPTGPDRALCLLVARLDKAVEHCRINRTNYEATTKFLTDADQSITRQEVSEVQEVQSAKKVKSIKDKEKMIYKSTDRDYKNLKKKEHSSKETKNTKMECKCGQSFYKWATYIKCCDDCFQRAKAEESSCSEDEPTKEEKPTKQHTRTYKKTKNDSQSNVKAIYILDNGEEVDNQQGDNHVNHYTEESDDEDDDDNIPRAKSARLRSVTFKSKHR